ncbi:hypothetical protein BJP62_11130 [Jeongeupia sp. USM3]|nr:hypothetical protein BJP62_11130 [Jeongeupia sp. USM3]
MALAFPALAHSAFAAEPYPALPATLSSTVTPNVLLHIDNSGSMGDRPRSGGDKIKMDIAKDVATKLIEDNPNLRWGIFSFDTRSTSTSGVLQAPIGSDKDTLLTSISNLSDSTWTPLGEAMVEITRYFGGQSSFYGKTRNTSNGTYTSPIQYRCQKNFAIVVTDGQSTKDNALPGVGGKSVIDYTSYDSADRAQSRSFQICQNTNTVSSVTCPATLEGAASGSSANRFYGNASDDETYGRSIRDVAMYAYDADFRVGGTDLDGKSFDDPKFLKQNLTTYTVGFDVNDPVLNATAIVGHGKYYPAGDENALTVALGNAVADIVDSISNAGGVATQSETVSVGNKVFQPVFNPKGWYGELRCFNLDGSGNFDPATSQCTPNGKAIIPAAASRKIHSAKVTGGTTTAFSFMDGPSTVVGNMTTAQKNALGANNTERQNVVRFLRGETVSGYRTRSNGLLGDIIDSQPVVVTKPSGQTPETSYDVFKNANAGRNMVFIGANDGMLHAFSIADMTEIMGYIPSAVYPHLKALTATDYGEAGTPHTYHVNGAMRQMDVRLGSAWKTILTGGLGQGGQGYFAIDATSAANFSSATSTVRWEWTDQSHANVGYAFGAPVIYNVRASRTTAEPAVILNNGYDADYDDSSYGTRGSRTSALYIVRASDGTLIKRIDVPGGAGLSAPAGVDYGQDGVLDYVYAGDLNGKLWRFDLTADSPDGFSVVSNPVYDAGLTHPIVMRPAIQALNASDGTSLGNMVVFGTGKLLTNADRLDTTTQTLYGVLDKLDGTTVAQSKLVAQTIVDTASLDDSGRRIGTYRKMSTNAIDLKAADNVKLGWYVNLPGGERLVTSPMLFNDKVLFGTGSTQSTEQCLPGGKGWIMGLNPLTGSVTADRRGRPYSFVDITPDLRSTTADQIGFGSGPAYASGYETGGIPTEIAYVAGDSKLVTSDKPGGVLGSAGHVVAQRESNSMGVYIGNAAPGVTTGDPSKVPASIGNGSTYNCTIGNDKCTKEPLLGPASGAKVETLTWREIK